MPYHWMPAEPAGERLHLWPYRSLSRRGFAVFMGVTATLMALPLVAVIGKAVLWGLLPFLGLTVWGLWVALQRSYRDGAILEDLCLGPQRVTLTRHDPDGRQRHWEANRYWLRIERQATGGPVPHYLTLHGGPRVVELGAFLTPEERLALEAELRARL